MRGGDVSKRNLKEFTIASNEIQKIVIRNSKIGWTEEKCIEMDKLAQEGHHSYCHLVRNSRDIKKTGTIRAEIITEMRGADFFELI